MARQRDIDWSNWKGHVERIEHPLSKPLDPKLKKGADVVHEALSTGNLPVLLDAPPQPTNEQLFGGGVVTEEMVKVADEKWNNVFNKHFSGFKQSIDHLNKAKVDIQWGYGKSFNSLLKEKLSDKEIAERNMTISE